MRQPPPRSRLPRRKLPLAAAAAMALLAAVSARAEIVNEASAGAEHGGRPVVSAPARVEVPVTVGRPVLGVTLAGRVEDDDGTPGLGTADAVTWTAVIENRGDVTLTGIVARMGGSTLACADAAGGPARLAPGGRIECVGRKPIGQSGLAAETGGDGRLDGEVTVRSAETGPVQASAQVVVALTPAMRLGKRVAAVSQLFPGVHAVEFRLTVENIGTAMLTGIALRDFLGEEIVSRLQAPPRVQLRGFEGQGGANAGYDGAADPDLLSGDLRLAPGRSGEAVIAVVIDTGPGSFGASNRAVATAAELAEPVPSEGGTETVLSILDTDGDGATDDTESATADRDGDGAPDVLDYDPTGYFYCETDGRIMPGGRIMVENLSTGGLQSGEGGSAGIRVLRDGSDGRYQFHVTAPGRYRLRYRLPPGGVASIARLPGPPAVMAESGRRAALGSGEAGDSGALADFSAEANPFRLEFEFREGDPPLLANNLPLRFCGVSQLAAGLIALAGPSRQADGRSRITYRIEVANSGSERVDEVQARADLAQAFGRSGYELVSTAIVTAPSGFAAVANPYFNGVDNSALLTSGGKLGPGERVRIDLTALVGEAGERRAVRVVATGLSPLDASALKPATAVVETEFGRNGPAIGIAVTVSAAPQAVKPGGRVAYEANFTAPAEAAPIDLVGQLPAGFDYLTGSGRIGDTAAEPERNGRELVWRGVAVAPGEPVKLVFDLAAGSSVTGPQFIAHAFARDAASGIVVSEIARAIVRRERESVFDCAEVIGRVFDDRNRDGYLQEGEPGIAGVALTGGAERLATSDRRGDFVIPCPLVPPAAIGGELSVGLDAASLPPGYRVTSANPRSLELSRGQTARINFGAASLRVVTHILDDSAFEAGTDRLKPSSLTALANVLNLLEEEISVLRLTYVARSGGADGAGRLEAARDLVGRAWSAKPRPYSLTIETRQVE